MNRNINDAIVLVCSLILFLALMKIILEVVDSQMLRIILLIILAVIVGFFVYKYETREAKLIGTVHARRLKLTDLETTMKAMFARGLTKKEIIDSINKQKWTKLDIEEALINIEIKKDNIKVSHDNVRQVILIVEKMRVQDIPDSRIKQALINKGWPEKIINVLFV